MVWHPPDDVEEAHRDLVAMRGIGVDAVRTEIIFDERILTAADTLGIQLFQDLPLDYLSAAGLRDTLSYAARVLALALASAREHPSARHFGLARRSDTRTPASCRYFEQLAEQVRRDGPTGSRSYYLSAYPAGETCANAVDVVLLDARDADPRLRPAWQDPDRRTGIGAVGTWVDAGARRGHQHPHSPEYQARYLERYLRSLLADTAETSPYAVFVDRWREVVRATPTAAQDLDAPYLCRYGLQTLSGARRPAYEVVAGIFTGRQTVFAFPEGPDWPSGSSWAILLGWSVFVLIGLCYASSPRFRIMIPRYFRARGFYREVIQEGRDLLLGISLALLLAESISAGIVGSVVLTSVRTTQAFGVLLHWMPLAVQDGTVALLRHPLLLVLLLGSIYALGIALWTTLLSFSTQGRRSLEPGQALMLVLWPRWTLLLLLVGAMLVAAPPDGTAAPFAFYLVGGWILLTLLAILRTLQDFVAVARISASRALLIGLVNPLVPALGALLALAIRYESQALFVVHLLGR